MKQHCIYFPFHKTIALNKFQAEKEKEIIKNQIFSRLFHFIKFFYHILLYSVAITINDIFRWKSTNAKGKKLRISLILHLTKR